MKHITEILKPATTKVKNFHIRVKRLQPNFNALIKSNQINFNEKNNAKDAVKISLHVVRLVVARPSFSSHDLSI